MDPTFGSGALTDDDDIWTTSEPEQPLPLDTYPTPDVDPGRQGFWSVGRVIMLLAAVAVVGVLVYLVVSRVRDGEQVSTSDDVEVPATDLWGREWEVDRLEMGAADPVHWSKSDTTTARYLDLTIKGEVRYTGCNGGSGTATYTDGILKADELVGTEMGCEDDEGAHLMAYDEWMASFLIEGVAVTFDDEGSLVLTGPDGTAWLSGPGELTDPDSTPDDTGDPGDLDDPVSNDALNAALWGHRWELQSITPTDSSEGRPIVPLEDRTAPEIDTTTADVLTISGCNGAGGAVYIDGDVVVADGPWAQTKMACDPDLMDQEQFLTEFLEAGPAVSIEDDVLTLTGDDWLVLAARL